MLSARAKLLLTEALQLGDDERAELTDELARTLPLSPKWLDELDARADEVDDSSVKLVPAAEAHARVCEGLAGLPKR